MVTETMVTDKTDDTSTSTLPPQYGEGETLNYKGSPIRVLPIYGRPFFALPDLVDALGFPPAAMDVVNGPDFPSLGKVVCYEEEDPEMAREREDVVALSAVGTWYFTALTCPVSGQGIAAWARRECARMCPNPVPGDPAVFLTLHPDGNLPPYPTRYSGRKSEWITLKEDNPGRSWALRWDHLAA